MTHEAIRASFRLQADWCERLGSPFTARLCAMLADVLDPDVPVAARVLDWTGDPTTDALAIRLCGGLHFLVRAGDAPALAACYPPAAAPSDDVLAQALTRTLSERSDALDPWIDGPPQTNEVGRSAVLMSGLLTVAARHPLPISLFELGASAGLNLPLDRFGYRLGGRIFGNPLAPLLLEPDWAGPPPPEARVGIIARAGVDLRPAHAATDRERLLAYVWPDQPRRLAQLEAAIAIAGADPPRVDRGDAGEWIEAQLPIAPVPGVVRVVMHSIAYQYFPASTRRRIRARLEAAGAAATAAAPLAWLRYEKLDEDEEYSLRLRTWPGEERLLGWVHPHGSWIRWTGDH